MIKPILFSLFCTLSISAIDPYEQEIQTAIVNLRKVTPSDKEEELKKFNSIMDENWKIFNKKKDISRPILINILKQEMASPNGNDLVLLDIGWFLALSDKQSELSSFLLNVYQKIDFTKKIISFNDEQFFRYSLFLSARQIPDFLPLIDKRYLRRESSSFVVPQHVIVVNGHSQRTHLYGVYGKPSNEHLLSILKSEKDVKIRRSLLSILRRTCTEACAQDIYELLRKETDHESFVNGSYIMLDNAGPKGRELYLQLKPSNLSEKTQDYLKSEQAYVKKVNFEYLVDKIEKKFGNTPNNFSETEILSLTERMIEDYGKSDRLHPLDFIRVKADKKVLIEKLMESRRKCFLRVNQHGLEDIDITNMVINALQYKK